MRSELGQFATDMLIDTCVRLQKTIDVHMAEKNGHNDVMQAMRTQNQALVNRNEELENELAEMAELTKGQVDSEEVEQLKKRVDELTTLNEGLQRKLVGV